MSETVEEKSKRLIERMRAARGYLYPTLEYAAKSDPHFTEAYANLSAEALLHEGVPTVGKALPVKYRELVAVVLLAYRGSTGGVLTHMRRALANGATKAELFEALEASVVPGGAPTFLTGVAALMQIEKEEEQVP